MEYTTIQKNISSSPRKLRLVADMVRKMDPYHALDILKFTNRGAATPLAKAIKTVIANAGSKEGLAFKSLEINEGLTLKRYRVGTAGAGRGRPYKKRMSQIKIVLTDEPVISSKKQVAGSKGKQSLRSKDLKKNEKKVEEKEASE